jgi:hypothetical protein
MRMFSTFFCIRLSAKFQIKQYQIEIFWLLLAVKTELASLSDYPVRRWCGWIERSYCYETSKRYAPTHNLISTIESLLWWFLDVITLPSKNSNQNAFRADFFFLWMLRASRSKTWLIHRLIKPFQGCFWYRAFVLNPLNFGSIASSHFCIAPYHMHHLTSPGVTKVVVDLKKFVLPSLSWGFDSGNWIRSWWSFEDV